MSEITENTTKNQDNCTESVETSTLDAILYKTVNEHPFTVSGGAVIIGVTILKIIKKIRGK
jgi:hypothetical protein